MLCLVHEVKLNYILYIITHISQIYQSQYKKQTFLSVPVDSFVIEIYKYEKEDVLILKFGGTQLIFKH